MTRPRATRFARDWLPALAAAAVLIMTVVLLAFSGQRVRDTRSHPVRRASAAPVSAPPKVEPEQLIPTDADQARAINAATPFLPGVTERAAPFRYVGDAADRERALTCLAAAAWYEAGDDPQGEAAVAQVVLNRLRHPAFPKTVCGVVFQGAELRSGCQFTFTCDGALARTPAPDAWTRARAIAAHALDGRVFAPVGVATHYHTDWVLPAWSGALDKLAAVGPHLFFKWRGVWGERAAFSGRLQPGESIDPRIAALAEPSPLPAEAAVAAPSQAPTKLPSGVALRLGDETAGEFAIEMRPGTAPGKAQAAATTLCGARTRCRVAGWLAGDTMAARLPMPLAALRSAAFLYRANRDAGVEQTLWNCRRVAVPDASSCMPGTAAPPPTLASGAAAMP